MSRQSQVCVWVTLVAHVIQCVSLLGGDFIVILKINVIKIMECFIKSKLIFLKTRISLVLGFALVTVVVKM